MLLWKGLGMGLAVIATTDRGGVLWEFAEVCGVTTRATTLVMTGVSTFGAIGLNIGLASSGLGANGPTFGMAAW